MSKRRSFKFLALYQLTKGGLARYRKITVEAVSLRQARNLARTVCPQALEMLDA